MKSRDRYTGLTFGINRIMGRREMEIWLSAAARGANGKKEKAIHEDNGETYTE